VLPISWLGPFTYGRLQFGWLVRRSLRAGAVLNADRLVLAVWLCSRSPVASRWAILVRRQGLCQYFLSDGPVQAGLLPHQRMLEPAKPTPASRLITQSMCRTVLRMVRRRERLRGPPATCIDIACERMLLGSTGLKPTAAFDRYGYVGLVIGLFPLSYSHLMPATGLNYFFRGWIRQEWIHSPPLLSRPIFCLGQPINLATPRGPGCFWCCGLCTWLGIRIGHWLRNYVRPEKNHKPCKASLPIHYSQSDSALESAQSLQVRHRFVLSLHHSGSSMSFLSSGSGPVLLLAPAFLQSRCLTWLLVDAVARLWLGRREGSVTLRGKSVDRPRFPLWPQGPTKESSGQSAFAVSNSKRRPSAPSTLGQFLDGRHRVWRD